MSERKKTRTSDTVGFGLAVGTYSSVMMKSVEMFFSAVEIVIVSKFVRSRRSRGISHGVQVHPNSDRYASVLFYFD